MHGLRVRQMPEKNGARVNGCGVSRTIDNGNKDCSPLSIKRSSLFFVPSF